jgi:Zn finger protein HypA/HybF involved in hydrogenase expression
MENENMGIVKVDGFKCERCGHLWISDKFTAKNPPIACAKCKSPYWNIPKKKGSQM